MNVLVVGAGFAGCVVAERLASAGHSILIIDKRDHLGGNAYDEYDAHGVLVHRYGPHIFHTNSQAVFAYLSRFTDWHAYQHRVLSQIDGKLVPFPINCDTLNQVYDLSMSTCEAGEFLSRVRVPKDRIESSEDAVLASVGHDLCDKFYRNYTRKQWGLELSELSPGVTGRIPVRTNYDDRYFTDAIQFMPGNGYTKMFERILDHKNIRIELETDYFKKRDSFSAHFTVYTGSLDAYFGSCLGSLPYRSLRFEHDYLFISQLQPVGTVNYPNDFPYTRITEFKHLTGQRVDGTSIVWEYPEAEGEPYYPIPTAANEALAAQYRQLAAKEKDVIFIGRLAQYKYLNMDQVVAAALKATRQL
jgi:UDP-galactopyranose mutase